MATNNKGLALAGIATGTILLWSGVRGASISASIKDVLLGTKPTGTNVNPTGASQLESDISGTTVASPTALPGSTSDIAEDAEKYNGDAYRLGASGPATFDCSGLVNYVCGHDLGLPIPGSATGKYTGHGPVTQAWYVWPGLTTVASNDMEAGDIVCWLTHMGIAVSETELISALNPSMGVQVTTIAGAAPGGPMRIRRYAYAPTPSGTAVNDNAEYLEG
jgi:cell wall-associated NlpC family hydrolase